LGQELRQFGTEAVDLRLETRVEHVADPCHAAAHPLAATTQIWGIKLRHKWPLPLIRDCNNVITASVLIERRS
jgi:hypothetical protein